MSDFTEGGVFISDQEFCVSRLVGWLFHLRIFCLRVDNQCIYLICIRSVYIISVYIYNQCIISIYIHTHISAFIISIYIYDYICNLYIYIYNQYTLLHTYVHTFMTYAYKIHHTFLCIPFLSTKQDDHPNEDRLRFPATTHASAARTLPSIWTK